MSRHLVALLTGAPHQNFWTKSRAVAAVSVVSQLIAFIVVKRPSWAPLQALFTALLAPGDVDAVETVDTATAILRKIRELKNLKISANAEEQVRLQAQIEALIDIIK